MTISVAWLFRFAHVLAATGWVGGYACVALLLLPAGQRSGERTLLDLSARLVRALTYAGVTTLFFGLLLVGRTRGYANFMRGEWGFVINAGLCLAVTLLGIGDGAIRPALREPVDVPQARRWALLALGLSTLAVALMTRTVHASN